MLKVSNEYAQSILSDNRDMPYRVCINGTTLEEANIPSMTLNESVSGTSGLTLGTSNAAELTLTLREPMLTNYDGMLVEPESGLVLPDGSTEWVPLGKFWVTKTTTNNNYKTVRLTCVDGMYHMAREYKSALKYPATIQAVVHEIVTQAGVEFIEPEVWPDVIVRIKPEKLTLRSAIGHAAGCCGCNARFNREGKLEFVWYADTGHVVELTQQYMDGLTKLHDKPLEVSFEITGEKEKYTVTVITDDNGDVVATPCTNVLEGDTVTLSVNPKNKYMLATISAVDANGSNVSLKKSAEGVGYTFTMPDSNVVVTASFKASNEGPFKLTVRTPGGGLVSHAISEIGHEEGYSYFDAGEEVLLFITPDVGYVVDDFVTTPGGLSIVPAGTSSDGAVWYSFIMPESDVTVTVYFREDFKYSITAYVDESEYSGPGYLFVEDAVTGEFPLRQAAPGTLVSVTVSPNTGYAFDRFESSVELTQINDREYRFVMPEEDVTIVAYYKLSEDETKSGMYAWLQTPKSPPSNKPCWAVFYRHNISVPVWKRFYLVWFDSWSAGSYSTTYGQRYYTVTMNGYYYCESRDTGDSSHAWDTSVWSGNGAAGSTLEWDAHIGFQYAGYADYTGEYCLLASNAHLYRGSSLLFEACPGAVEAAYTHFVIDGEDVRERGALSYYKCPDTFSTPLPATNWMVLQCDSYISMMQNEYETWLGKDSADGFYILFFDDISIANIGPVFNNSDESFYHATVTNGHYCALKQESSTTSWTLRDISEGATIGLRNPRISQHETHAMLGGVYFSGVLASSKTIWGGGNPFIYGNACKICDCGSGVSTFSLRRNAAAADPVTLTYTNPMIYEKMVSSVQDTVQGFTYTPARIKHRGLPHLQAGDIISAPDKDGVYHTILVQQQTLTFGGGMNAEVSCPGQTNGTASFAATNPAITQIKEDLNKSYSELEHDLAANNAASFAAMYKALNDLRTSLTGQINGVNDDVHNVLSVIAGIENRLLLIETAYSNTEERFVALETDVSHLENNMIAVQEDVRDLEQFMEALELRVAAIEDDTDLGNLKRQLSETDKQIAHCAEIFMLEVMVNGTEISAVVLPYNISELHTTRETLRAQIAELEV